MQTTQVTPKIYVACLAAYNNGKLYGKWIDAAQDADEIHEEIQAMLKNSPEPMAEEWAIHDYEGFEGYSLGEYGGIETTHEIACFIDYERMGRDMEMSGDIYTIETGFEEVHVFWSH